MKKKYLLKCRYSLEYTKYHPETLLGRHIALVTLRGLLWYNSNLLMLAGLLHDICKPNSGKMIITKYGEHWQNSNHANEASDFIVRNREIFNLCNRHNVDVHELNFIVANHMDKAKDWTDNPIMQKFMYMDNMIQSWTPDDAINRTLRLDGRPISTDTIVFIGMSDLQIANNRSDRFTITIGRTPKELMFSKIPDIFLDNGGSEEVYEYLKLLV